MNFEWVQIGSVDQNVIDEFDSGDYAFNMFLKEKAEKWQNSGEAVTYLCVNSDEINTNITRIYGYAAINTLGLLYHNSEGKNKYLQCAEIRMFAISKALRRKINPGEEYSKIIFKSFLQKLYYMSMDTIGFKAIFLNSNEIGYHLYKDCGFLEISDYVPPEEDDKIEVEECRPLLLVMNEDAIYELYD